MNHEHEANGEQADESDSDDEAWEPDNHNSEDNDEKSEDCEQWVSDDGGEVADETP